MHGDRRRVRPAAAALNSMNAHGTRRVRLGLVVLCLPALFALGDAARDPAPPPSEAAAGRDGLVGEVLADGFWEVVFPDGLGAVDD
jgi:hypothetical protein